MIDIYDVIKQLTGKDVNETSYKSLLMNKKEPNNKENHIDINTKTDFTFDGFISLLCSMLELNKEEEKKKISKILNNPNINLFFNTVKINNCIKENTLSDNLILFLSCVYKTYIYILNYPSNIVRIYYIDDYLESSNKSVFFIKDYSENDEINFLYKNKNLDIFTYDNEYLQEYLKNFYSIQIGVNIDKILILASESNKNKEFKLFENKEEDIIDDSIYETRDTDKKYILEYILKDLVRIDKCYNYCIKEIDEVIELTKKFKLKKR